MSVTQAKPDFAVSDVTKTAVIYLRVSSTGQLTGHSEEGYSIEVQREACRRYAESLGARVVAEYVEPGKSGKTIMRREELQRLLVELPELQPDFVIVYDLSRLARDEADAFYLLAQIRNNGSRLMSTREPVDDSPTGLLMFALMTGVNAYRPREDGVKVKAGLERKHADGGTIGKAPIGYINTRERVEGREVRVVEIDPERAPLVRMAFDLYATGDYPLTKLCGVLEKAGLKTRLTAKRAPTPL